MPGGKFSKRVAGIIIRSRRTIMKDGFLVSYTENLSFIPTQLTIHSFAKSLSSLSFLFDV
jgi:hypothetical protein